MSMAKRNLFVKALQSAMATAKKTNAQARIEWEMACNTNSQRGHVFDQSELLNLYSNYGADGETGATKVCHLDCHNGDEFQFIVVKRFKRWGHAFSEGNQLIEEINAWQRLAETPDADYICPILKYFTSKSDKVADLSDTMKRNVLIIAQKACYVSYAKRACEKAEQMNREHGYIGDSAVARHAQLKRFAEKMGWWDALDNPGNSGVIFDYASGCYKAVFIDYAL